MLPQEIPRIPPDIISSGFLRRSFLEMNKPVIYLHGHTHQPSIEIIRDPTREYQNSLLINIGVGDFPKHFNIIEIILLDDYTPIAVNAIHYQRKNPNFASYLKTPSRVCLIPITERFKMLSNCGKAIFKYFSDNNTNNQRFSFFKQLYQDEYESTEIVQEIELLSNLEYLTILNPDKEPSEWSVEWRR